jgi:hypothetical protein
MVPRVHDAYALMTVFFDPPVVGIDDALSSTARRHP